MLGLSGWKTRICTLVFGLGLYLVFSTLISTRRLSFPPDGMQASYESESSSSSFSNSHPAAAHHHHHPRNLASAALLPSTFNNDQKPTRRMRPGPQIDWCQAPLNFLAPAGPTTALASFPGSGNTWLRYLVQQATGYLTGSVYKDYALLKNGFPAENVSNGSVLMVKTHEFGPEARSQFDRVILLVRDPFSSLRAEFNRRSGGHTGHASIDRYKRNGGKYWKNFVSTKGEEWEKMNLEWFTSFSPENRLVVFYDQLVQETMAVLQTVLDFLQVSVPGSTLQCVMDRREGIFKRSKKKLGIEVFTSPMKTFLMEKQAKVFNILLINSTANGTSRN